MITSLGFKAKVRLQKCKKARYAIGNVIKKAFRRLLGILINYLMKYIRRRFPNMILLIATFI